jgi:uncharacterized protein YuzE
MGGNCLSGKEGGDMKVRYDRETDITILELSGEKVDHAEEMENIIVHFTEDDRPVLLEILNSSEFLPKLAKVTMRAKSSEPVEISA